MADDLEFSSRSIRVNWDKLDGIGSAYPAIGFRKDGSAVVFCGIRMTPAAAAESAPESAPVTASEPASESAEDGKQELLTPPPPEHPETPDGNAGPELKKELAIWDPRGQKRPQAADHIY